MTIKKSLVQALTSNGLTVKTATKKDWYNAVGSVVQDSIMEQSIKSAGKEGKHVSYLSAEFLMGRLASNNLHNLGLFTKVEKALKGFGVDIYEITEEEQDLALANGGLGRLAACFIDSMTTLDMNATGYGIHYEHGLFKQTIENCHQVEQPDYWRVDGCAWEVKRPELEQSIQLYGNTRFTEDGVVWENTKTVRGICWDIPVVGWEGKNINMLRLWEAKADKFFDWDAFNRGDYQGALADNVAAETISKVLYPNDETDAGKELRFIQQYFFCACSLKDLIAKYDGKMWTQFADENFIQLNDTHPSVAIPELMRILIDEEKLSWDTAWGVCQKVFSYTNHTLLVEALECLSVKLFEKVLPRHLQIIYEINARFLATVEDQSIHPKVSIVGDGVIRMANLCVVTSHKVNGVAEVHSELVKTDLFPEYNSLWPEKFVNVSNGVTQRRWLKACNPELANLYTKTVGKEWITDLIKIGDMTIYADDKKMQKKFADIKHKNKLKLVDVIKKETGIEVSADAIFDVQVKRIHLYKRQSLDLLHIMALYKRLIDNPDYNMHQQVFIFSGKAAPSYALAKDIIYAINKVGEMVNDDPRVRGLIKVVFLPNYSVSLAESIVPAADIHEQISLAGFEASGTSCMKFSLNGAIAIATYDGASIEQAEEAGAANMGMFGMTVPEVKDLKSKGYNPYDVYNSNTEIKEVLDWMVSGDFEGIAFTNIHKALLEEGDEYMALADFDSYQKKQKEMNTLYGANKTEWNKRCIINSSTTGKFSSDRSIQDYYKLIWK
jgi:glycogen phosphorylase